MKSTQRLLGILLTVLLLLSVNVTCSVAALRDFGPIKLLGGFPAWYRDNNGVAVQQCLSRAVSPLPNAATGLPICNILPNPNSIPPFDANLPITFYPNPPTNYNYPDESFYYSLSPDPTVFDFVAGKGKIVIVLALESAFTSGSPIPGDQVVFSRVRVFLTKGVPDGNYKITHPYGVENLTVTGGLLRFTRDIGLVGPAFTGPLAGDMGPFFTWTVDPALPLGSQNADGTLNGLDPVTKLPNGDVFLGDFNIGHTFQGSPFGTNYFRVDGPVGSGIGGPGVDFIQSNMGLLEGWKYTIPIPSPLTIDRSTYRRDPLAGQIDVFATTSSQSNQATPSSLTITGANIIPAAGVVMNKDAATGKFFAHIDNIAPALFPSQITVTNTADNPPTAVVGDLADEIFISEATYEPLSKTLTIKAASGDLLNNPPPALIADQFGAIPALGTLVVAGVNAPPPSIRVASAAHGSATKQLLVQAFPPPLAGNDSTSVLNINPAASSVVINVLVNDSATAPATLAPASVAVGTAPVHGTTSINTVTGAITYTLSPVVSGPGSDAFTYTVTDSNGVTSLPATVTVTINSNNIPPVANNDTASGVTGASIVVPVLGNDTSSTSTLNPNSIIIVTPPISPATAVPLNNGTGNVNFTSSAPGVYSFQYTVKDNFSTPATSNVATAVVTVTAPVVPPTAVNDPATVAAGSSVVINAAGNDTAGTNPINPASVAVVALPANGTVIANAGGAGTITYTPAAGFVGTNTFTYNIKDTLGVVSNNATVNVTVTAPATETLAVTRAQFTLNGVAWRIDGTTSARVTGETIKIFNSALVPADFTVGLIATVPVGGNGSWTLSQNNPAINAARRISIRSSLGKNLENIPVTVR